MVELVLQRVAVGPEGAFGVLLRQGEPPFAVTLERTYPREGASEAPKIPAGRWRCTRSFFHRGGYATFEIHVPGFSRLLFHRGNLETDSEGCVLVGERFDRFGWQSGVGQSALAHAELMTMLRGIDECELVVLDPPAVPMKAAA